MTEYEIYVMPKLKFWKVGEKGKPTTLPSGIDGAGAGDSVSLDEFIEQMKSTIEKAIQPGDSVAYKPCSPPWWDPLWEIKTQEFLIPSKIVIEKPRYIQEVIIHVSDYDMSRLALMKPKKQRDQ